jgi:2Fe-2S ferredoxin
MTPIRTIDRAGRTHSVALAAGLSLMEALRDAGLPIAAICGGAKSCATCHVYLENAPDLTGPHQDEIELLEESENFRPGTSRLSCQIRTDELPQTAVVTLAPEEI